MRRFLILVATTVVVVSLSPILATAGTNGSTTLVSVSSTGEQGNNLSRFPSVSADGRFVTFYSAASNLVPNDANGQADLFVRDRQTGATSLVSVSSTGQQSNGESLFPSISADGRFVAFYSYASNLVPGDTNFSQDVFVRDRQTGTTTRVSVSSSGHQGNRESLNPSISVDGRFVAFDSAASNLVRGDTNFSEDVFVRDLQAGTTTLVSRSSTGQQGDSSSLEPSISADGRFVAFDSDASNLVPDNTHAGFFDVYVRDRQTGTTTRVSVSSTGEQANNNSISRPSLSADGRFVAFHSDASNLVPGDSNGVTDVFVRDRRIATTTRVSVSSSDQQGDKGSYEPSISADGRFVAFQSAASNLVPGDTNGLSDVFVRDRQAATTVLISVSSAGQPSNGDSGYPSISADGRLVAFESLASNLVPVDTNGFYDVFARDRGAPTTGFFAVLRGANVSPGPGDPNGVGVVILHFDDRHGLACVRLSASGTTTPTAAQVHAGAASTTGPVVIDLSPVLSTGKGCVAAARATILAIRAHPGQYYVDVHTADFPAGALRGQLKANTG